MSNEKAAEDIFVGAPSYPWPRDARAPERPLMILIRAEDWDAKDRLIKDLGAKLAAQRNELALVQALNSHQSDTIRHRTKAMEDLRVDRAEVVKAAGESIAEFQSIIKSLREQLAAKPQPKTESELIADDLRHLARQGGPAWSCLLSLADRVQQIDAKTITANYMTVDPNGEYASMLLTLIKFHKNKIKAILA